MKRSTISEHEVVNVRVAALILSKAKPGDETSLPVEWAKRVLTGKSEQHTDFLLKSTAKSRTGATR
jgi:hypothetical protein